MPELWELRQKQSLPLEAKVNASLDRIRKWADYWQGDVYVSFSGGKDSTVLLDLVRSIYPQVPAVFVNTGLEYPEIVEFIHTVPGVTEIRPEMNFRQVLERYGYPVVSKRIAQYVHEVQASEGRHTATRHLRLTGFRTDGTYSSMGVISKRWRYLTEAPFKISDDCCTAMKKRPMDRYVEESGRKPYVGTMASEGQQRIQTWLLYGCNAFDIHRPRSTPLSIWTEHDVWDYIHSRNLPYSPIYDMGYPRTGCMFCMFGVHLEPKPNRFQRMAKTHPKLWDYCIHKLGCGQVLDYIGVPYGNEEAFQAPLIAGGR